MRPKPSRRKRFVWWLSDTWVLWLITALTIVTIGALSWWQVRNTLAQYDCEDRGGVVVVRANYRVGLGRWDCIGARR